MAKSKQKQPNILVMCDSGNLRLDCYVKLEYSDIDNQSTKN